MLVNKKVGGVANVPPEVNYVVVKDAGSGFTVDFTSLNPESGDQLLIMLTRGTVFGNGSFTGFSQTTNIAPGNYYSSLAIWSKTSDGTETTLTNSGNSSNTNLCFVVCIKGWSMISDGGGAQGLIAAPPNPPAVTATSGDYALIVGAVGTNGTVTITPPSGYETVVADTYEGGTYDANLMMALSSRLPAGSEDPGVCSGQLQSWCAETILLRAN